MSARNTVELAANQDVDGTAAFEGSFEPAEVHELMVEMDPKHCGPPICVLSDGGANSKEVHPLPLRGREGRYSAMVGGGVKYAKIRVTTARNIRARLVKVKLISGAGHHAAPAATPPAATPPA